MRVFLGGTCNESTWRQRLIPMLQIPYFDPVVDDWDAVAQEREDHAKKTSTYHLYCITPQMSGTFSIAEVVYDSFKLEKGCTILTLLRESDGVIFNEGQWRSLDAVARLIQPNGVKVFYDLESTAEYLNCAD